MRSGPADTWGRILGSEERYRRERERERERVGSVSSSQTILLKHQINTFKELHFGRLETALHMRLAGECDIMYAKTNKFW